MIRVVEGSQHFTEVDQIINTLKHFQWELNRDERDNTIIVKPLSFEEIIANLEHTKKFGYELRKLNEVSSVTYYSILNKIQNEIMKFENQRDNLSYNQERVEISLGIYKSLLIDIQEIIKTLEEK